MKMELCKNNDITIIMQSPCVFSNKNLKMAGVCCVFKFVWHSVDRKHLMHLESESSYHVVCTRVQSMELTNHGNKPFFVSP